MKSPENKYINIEQLADCLSISVFTLYSWVHQKKIPYYKFGKAVRFKMQEINEWIENNRIETFKF
jgi:excisionase family DNA binding protein